MTREQMIDEAVRDYMEYRDCVAPGTPGKYWARKVLEQLIWLQPAWLHDTGAIAAIRLAYWKIQCEEAHRHG